MYFTNLSTKLFFQFKAISKDCYYTVSTNGRCWKFMFDNDYGIALVKHVSLTQDDLWSAVAIRVEDHHYYPVDDIWLNRPVIEILEYAHLIKGGFFE